MTYVVTFHDLTLAEASLACTCVAKEVCDLLFGADVDEISIRGWWVWCRRKCWRSPPRAAPNLME